MTYIIAEAGVNHNGNIALAENLIEAAASSGANAIKFQAWKAENLVTRSAPLAGYQERNTSGFVSQYEMLKTLELSENDHKYLKKKCDEKKIEYLSSAFDIEGIEVLNNLGINKLKIPSGEITNLPFLIAAGKYKWEIILSTGMSNMQEIEEAIICLESNGKLRDQITILQCTTQYPAPLKSVNLAAMKTISEAFNLKIGFSDHTEGIIAAIAAVAMGAQVIEKHLTLDKNLPGPDHKASIEPDEFKLMIENIRTTELLIGNGIKVPNECEVSNKAIARKSIVAKKYIKKGELLTSDNLCVKRPGTGISPMQWDNLIGKTAQQNYNIDDLIEN